MSLNDGTGEHWDESSPADGDFISVGAQEIRDLRIGVDLRTEKEHVAFATGTIGGEHLAGSAKAYTGTSDPTVRPNAATSFDFTDAGRVFINTSTSALRYYTGSAWAFVKLADASQIPNGFITSAMIADGTILTADIGEGQVTSDKLAAGAILTATIGEGQVTGDKLSVGAVGATQIATASLTKSLFATGVLPLFAAGSYTGNGSASPGNSITVGFKPDLVLIQKPLNNTALIGIGTGANPGRLGDIAQGEDTSGINFSAGISYDTNGFTILVSDTRANQSGVTYLWAAFKANPA